MLSEFPHGNYTPSLWFTIIHVDLSRRHSSCCSTKIESLTEICAIKSDTSVLVGVKEASQRPQDIFDLPCLKIWKWFRDLQMPRYNDNTELCTTVTRTSSAASSDDGWEGLGPRGTMEANENGLLIKRFHNEIRSKCHRKTPPSASDDHLCMGAIGR